MFLTTNKKIIVLNKNKKKEVILPKNLFGQTIDANFSDIVFDQKGRQWYGTYGDGLYLRAENDTIFQRISQLTFNDPLPLDLNILDLHRDKKNRLWIATYGRGLYLVNFEKRSITNFTVEKHNPRALHYKDVLCIYEDYSGTLWFGTDGGGISYYDEYLEKFNSLTNYQTPENISIDVVRAITLDREKNIWIGTSGKGLTQYEPFTNSWRTFRNNVDDLNRLSSNRIMSLLEDENQNLWIGTQGGGLNIYTKDADFLHYNKDSKIPLSAQTIWCIYKDNQGRKWLGTRGQGLIQFDILKGEIRKYTHQSSKNGLPNDNIRVITSGGNGLLWVGTESDGICLIDISNNKFKTYKQTAGVNSLSNNKIKSLYRDDTGILWIGTNGGGLNAFDINREQFYNYTTDDGLANNVVYAVLPDGRGNLWLSSNKGITKFTPGKTLEAAPAIVNYNNYDGLATEFNTGAYYTDGDGKLYFGGLEGFYWFRPEEIKENKILPKTTITNFEVLNENYALTKGTQLKHDQNTLAFTFSSLQFSLPEKNLYQYRLVNYDDEWVYAGNKNFARYSHVPPGEYQFQVKSSNYDGVWNEQPVNFSFRISPPWYLSTTAKILYVLLLMATAYAVYSYLKWRWRMKLNLQLKEEEAVRLQKLNAFKSKLYTDISHEFRTPLTLIAGPVDAKLGEGSLTDSDFANFSMIKRNTNRLIHLVDQLLHLAKLEKGKLKLKIASGDLGLFLGAIASSFDYKAELRHIDYKVSISEMAGVWYDEDAVEKIVTNLLSNALKYCPENGQCHFKATASSDNVKIVVSNTVEEMVEDQIDELFNRFYQKDEYAEGAGVGLSLVKELVQLYRGEVKAYMEHENQINFIVELPAKKELFNEDEILEDDSKGKSPLADGVSDIIEVSEEVTAAGSSSNELPIVLVVEDQLEVRAFLKSVWINKYHFFEAENGKDGIDKALEIIPDLIITDVRMPICDGIELCNRLKTDERTSHIPIILLTAGTGEEDELKGLHSGADDFITKPFKLRILEKRVENLMASRKALRGRYSQEIVLKAKDIAITHTDELFLNRMQKVLDDHLSDPDFNAALFCRALGMSRMQLHRKLLAFTNLSTTAFIRSQRLKQALQILQNSDASVSEVAYAVGFNTPSYFIKCFKETYKKTPSEYFQSSNHS